MKRRASILMFVMAATGGVIPAQVRAAADSTVIAPVAVAPLFAASDLLWMEVRANGRQLAESMDAYSSRAGVFLPLGQFSRVLDLAVTVLPPEQRAEGWILTRDNRVAVDLKTLTATSGDQVIRFSAAQAMLFNDDLYLRTDLMEALLPVKLRADPAAQLLTVAPTRTLPFTDRLARSEARAGLSVGAAPSRGVPVETPYRAFTLPFFDVTLGGQRTRDGSDQSRQYSLRAASDLAYAGFRGFVGSDDKGHVNDVRLSLERKSPSGDALGPLGGVRAGIGDVFTPSAAIGVASVAGRGFYYSSAPLESVDLSTPVNLRGELGLGEEVELYVNETLRASQATPLQGRYEFLDVRLALGMNVIRLIFYGAQGQKRMEVRRINLGAGQVEAGQIVMRLGAVQQELSVIGTGQVDTPSSGALRSTAVIDYGISSRLTASAGLARYTPRNERGRTTGFGGLRGALNGMALQADVAVDDQGGRGATLGVAARPFDIAVVAHHSEYSGGFVDETRLLGVLNNLGLRRASDIRADASLRAGQVVIPLSADASRLERSDGSVLLRSSARASAPLLGFYASTNITYYDDSAARAGNQRMLTGVDVSTLVARRVQLRAGLSYQIEPQAQIDAAYVLSDIQLSETQGLHLGATRSSGRHGQTSLQGSHIYRARRFELATNASYETHSRQWRLGLQIAFSLVPDPVTNRYQLERPGAATGGAAAVDAFVDQNGDGIHQPGELPVAGVVINTPSGAITTDAGGHAHVDRLGDAGAETLRIDAGNADDPFLSGAPAMVEIVPRPGRVSRISLAMRQSAEIEIVAMLQRPDNANRALSALNVELVPATGGAPVGARTDHAGIALFEGILPGVYSVRLQPEQSKGLGLSLAKPATITVPADGGYVRGGEILIDVTLETAQ